MRAELDRASPIDRIQANDGCVIAGGRCCRDQPLAIWRDDGRIHGRLGCHFADRARCAGSCSKTNSDRFRARDSRRGLRVQRPVRKPAGAQLPGRGSPIDPGDRCVRGSVRPNRRIGDALTVSGHVVAVDEVAGEQLFAVALIEIPDPEFAAGEPRSRPVWTRSNSLEPSRENADPPGIPSPQAGNTAFPSWRSWSPCRSCTIPTSARSHRRDHGAAVRGRGNAGGNGASGGDLFRRSVGKALTPKLTLPLAG